MLHMLKALAEKKLISKQKHTSQLQYIFFYFKTHYYQFASEKFTET